MRRAPWLPLALGLAAGPTLSAQEHPNAARETFLREAHVVSQETIATGITRPQQVELEMGGETRRAVFKSFERTMPEQIVTVGNESQRGLRDSWKFEVAAYELDKLLGLGMVPVTVVREIDGREGALIDWVDGVLPEYETSTAEFSLDAWRNQIEATWVFDYLAYNIDRTLENLLVIEGFRIRLIDHSRAFQKFLQPMRPFRRFPGEVVEKLRALDPEALEAPLGGLLDRDEMEALLERRKLLLEHVDQLLAQTPGESVFFSHTRGDR